MTQPPVDQQDAGAPPERPGRRGGPPVLTLVLGGVLVLVLGFFGGLGVSKLTGGSGGRQPAAFPSGGDGKGFGTGGPRRPGGGGGGLTVGTVEKVVGSTVYLKTPDGRTVKVTTTAGTSVQVSRPGKVGDLTKGSTVVVRGSRHGGTVSADRIDQGGVAVRGPRPSRTP